MLFMGAFMLIVLPLFLVISARMTARSEFGKKPAGIAIQVVFYGFTLLSLLGLVLLIVSAIK